MNILLVGSGGREHALAWKLSQSDQCDRLYIAPGNPGTAEVGENTPVHLSAYHPSHKLHERRTPAATLLKARDAFGRYLKHVYLGNVLADTGADTVCRECGAIVIGRLGYRVGTGGMNADGTCAACGADVGVVTGERGTGGRN